MRFVSQRQDLCQSAAFLHFEDLVREAAVVGWPWLAARHLNRAEEENKMEKFMELHKNRVHQLPSQAKQTKFGEDYFFLLCHIFALSYTCCPQGTTTLASGLSCALRWVAGAAGTGCVWHRAALTSPHRDPLQPLLPEPGHLHLVQVQNQAQTEMYPVCGPLFLRSRPRARGSQLSSIWQQQAWLVSIYIYAVVILQCKI